MCGIAGFIDLNPSYDPKLISTQMGDAIYKRGPDSEGIWQDSNYGVNLIHRRLAILDLTSAGHQPMISHCGRYIMAFNGEIYNFMELRKELEASCDTSILWRGHSDSEVILQGFSQWGVEQTLQKCEGMFAIALWDREKQDLYLMRDRIGEKPLYYGYFSSTFGFASELKAFKKHPKFNPEINRDAIGQLMLHNCIPAPTSIFDDMYKLMPGHYIKLSYNEYRERIIPMPQPYWQLIHYFTSSYSGGEEQATYELDLMLQSVISQQMVSDVPLGCFLSGGVDSSLIAAIMQKLSANPVKTFTIGFEQAEYNEAIYAKAVAQHIGTEHHELYITDRDAMNVIPSLSDIYDEPFSDSSQIPTFLVSKLAKTNVTVSLSGDGGDELFGGYQRYLHTNKIKKFMRLLPVCLRPVLNKILVRNGEFIVDKGAKLLNINVNNPAEKIHKLSYMLASDSFEELYLALTSHWLELDNIIYGVGSQKSLWLRNSVLSSSIEKMMYLDTMGYLPDDILVKVDRAAMANSLETRVPFLNHNIVSFAASLPLSYKIKKGQGKSILRNVLYNYVPRELIERPKQGFSIPIQEWMRGELKDWACTLLDKKIIQEQGFFNAELVDRKLEDHLMGKANNAHHLWDILMFQQWINNWKEI